MATVGGKMHYTHYYKRTFEAKNGSWSRKSFAIVYITMAWGGDRPQFNIQSKAMI